jgi:hypothetical protein
MRKTDYKVDIIKDYIINNAPTRSELIRFIAVDLNKVSGEYFDKYPRSFRGYYATNISVMRSSGNIWSKNSKYYVTKQGLTNENSLYRKPYKKQLQDLKLQHSRELSWKQNWINEHRKEINQLKIDNAEYKATLNNINMLSKID